MRYGFESPPGWIERPFPPPQRGVYLTEPPGTPRAAVLLTQPIVPHGTLAEQLERAVADGCVDAEILEQTPPRPQVTGSGLTGLVVQVRVRVTARSVIPEEIRIFVLLEAPDERIPLILLMEPDALPQHAATLEQLLCSIHVLSQGGQSLY